MVSVSPLVFLTNTSKCGLIAIKARGKSPGALVPMSSNLLGVVEVNHFHSGFSAYYTHVLSLFDTIHSFSHVAEFAHLALQFLDPEARDFTTNRTELLSRLFHASVQTARYDDAYSALSRYTNTALQKSALTALLKEMISTDGNPEAISHLLRLPFSKPDLRNHVDVALDNLANQHSPSATSSSFHRVLYAWRIRHSDFRGAAVVLWERLQRLKARGDIDHDTEMQAVRKDYLALINVLACVEPGQAWILAEPDVDVTGDVNSGGLAAANGDTIGGSRKGTRRLVTLEDVRKEYQGVLDRVAAIETGAFSFGDTGSVDG